MFSLQIDYLQQKNGELQRQLDSYRNRAQEASSATMDLDSRNQTLERELRDVDYMAQQMQLDKDTALRVADREVTDARAELQRSRSELETMDLELAKLRADNETLLEKLAALEESLAEERQEHNSTEELLDKVQADKRKLAQRLSKMTANGEYLFPCCSLTWPHSFGDDLITERDLVLEIDRLKCKNGVTRGKRGSKTPTHTEMFIKGLEEERDYWKGEVSVLQKLMKNKTRPRSPSPTLRSRSRSLSPARSKPLTPTPTRKSKSRSSSPVATPTKVGFGSNLFFHVWNLV